jgi:hypothetical protein
VADVTRRRAWSLPLTAAVIAALLSGCTGAVGSPEARGVDTDRRTPTTADTGPPDAPAARSGDLGQEDLPQPSDLGRGWSYRVDNGNAEDGYLGSGEPAIARDPVSVLAAITPLGCRPGRLPMPVAALEVTYTRGDLPGVGLLLQFGDDAAAARFFAEHSGVLDRCAGSSRVELSIKRHTEDLLVSTRVEQLGETPVWTEGVGLRGTEVMLIAVADPSGAGVRSVISALA